MAAMPNISRQIQWIYDFWTKISDTRHTHKCAFNQINQLKFAVLVAPYRITHREKNHINKTHNIYFFLRSRIRNSFAIVSFMFFAFRYPKKNFFSFLWHTKGFVMILSQRNFPFYLFFLHQRKWWAKIRRTESEKIRMSERGKMIIESNRIICEMRKMEVGNQRQTLLSIWNTKT